ncbi:MAG: hypothetical protein QM676_07315 [Novosphingobium sp.]
MPEQRPTPLSVQRAQHATGVQLASSRSPTHIQAMEDVSARLKRIHRNLRQITWMMAAIIVLEAIVLVKVFSQ